MMEEKGKKRTGKERRGVEMGEGEEGKSGRRKMLMEGKI